MENHPRLCRLDYSTMSVGHFYFLGNCWSWLTYSINYLVSKSWNWSLVKCEYFHELIDLSDLRLLKSIIFCSIYPFIYCISWHFRFLGIPIKIRIALPLWFLLVNLPYENHLFIFQLKITRCNKYHNQDDALTFLKIFCIIKSVLCRSFI